MQMKGLVRAGDKNYWNITPPHPPRFPAKHPARQVSYLRFTHSTDSAASRPISLDRLARLLFDISLQPAAHVSHAKRALLQKSDTI